MTQLSLDALDEVEEPYEEADEEAVQTVRYSITSYGADYPVDALVKRLSSGAIEIPGFQRGYVWTLPQASRFIESLLLGLPVPAVFLSRQAGTNKLLVIDGQQRLRSLQFFYDGVFKGREFELHGVVKEFDGCTYKTLTPEDQRRLDDALLHAIVVQQEDPQDDQTGLYNLFERINTGGTPLHPQEIRACIYPGKFLTIIRHLAQLPAWSALFGNPSARGKDQELILRFFAVHYWQKKYERPMKHFLNRFMHANQNCAVVDEKQLVEVFEKAVGTVLEHLGPEAVRPVRNLNTALTEALLVGTARRQMTGPIQDIGAYKKAFSELMSDSVFMDAYENATTDVDRFNRRLDRATAAFASVG